MLLTVHSYCVPSTAMPQMNRKASAGWFVAGMDAWVTVNVTSVFFACEISPLTRSNPASAAPGAADPWLPASPAASSNATVTFDAAAPAGRTSPPSRSATMLAPMSFLIAAPFSYVDSPTEGATGWVPPLETLGEGFCDFRAIPSVTARKGGSAGHRGQFLVPL